MDPFNFLDGQDILNLLSSFDSNISPDAYARDLHVTESDITELIPSTTGSFEATQSNTPTSYGETPNNLGRSSMMHHGSNFPTDAYRRELPHIVTDFDGFFHAGNSAGNPMRYFERISRPLSSEMAYANSPISSSEASLKDHKKRSLSPEYLPECLPAKRARGTGSSRFKTEAERQETRNTREKGACLPCQINKRRCIDGPDPDGPCTRCLERNMALGIPLCFRPKIRDIEVFRRGPTLDFAWSCRWKIRDARPEAKSIWKPITELPAGRNDRFKMVELSQGHSHENLRLRVREYAPEPGDRQHYTWYDGDVEHFYRTPAYAIAELGYARNAIKKFLEINFRVYLGALLQNASPITRYTFETALNNQDLTLLEPALKLWVASRFIETPWHIAGPETLGMSKDSHIKSPYHEQIPQTPIMDFQLDNLVIYSLLQPLLKEILNTLKTKTLSSRMEDWFELQLTHYILLNTVELTLAHDVEFARLHNIKKSQWSNGPLIEMVTQGANTLLAYYHNANKGHYPFSAPWPEVERSHQWSEEQKLYITKVRELLGQHREVVTEPAREMFWTGQLHRAEWNAVTITV